MSTFVGRRGLKALERVLGGLLIGAVGPGRRDPGTGPLDDPANGAEAPPAPALPPAPAAVKRILISKWGHIGDTILMVPALRALRRAYPGAEIETLCTAKNAEIARWAPEFGSVIEFDPHTIATRPFRARALLRRLRARPYDLVIDFEQWARASALLARAARLSPDGLRIGFDSAGERRARAFHRTVPYAEGTPADVHEVDAFRALAAAAGATPEESDLALPWMPVDLRAADDVVGAQAQAQVQAQAGRDSGAAARFGSFIVLYPGGVQKPGVHRRWAPERFAALADALYAERGVPILVVGDASERALGERVAAAATSPVRVIAGETTLPELAAVCARAELFVGNDSGPMHLAAAVGCREVVGIFGATSWRKWRPWGAGHRVVSADVTCSPCFAQGRKGWACPAGEGACMGAVEVDAVLASVAAGPAAGGR